MKKRPIALQELNQLTSAPEKICFEAKHLLVGFILVLGAHSAKAYGPCNIKLSNLSTNTGKPGDELILYGEWGHLQGEKLPCINKGNTNRLEVLSWLPSRVRTKIPENLEPGNYKVGVYCNDLSEGGAYSSTWVDFKVLPANEPATFEEGVWQEQSKKISVHNGLAYRVRSYDGETLTVEIDVPALLPQRYEINARNGAPHLPDGALGDRAKEILNLGANYVDVSYNTARIAAEFPLKVLTWTPWIEGKTVELLYAIRDEIEK